jgi:hypothetical protein
MALGLEDGLSSVFDLRMMLPFCNTRTVPPRQIVPTFVGARDGYGFAACDGNTIDFVCGRDNQVMRTISGPEMRIMTYGSGVLVVDPFSCSYIRDWTSLCRVFDRGFLRGEFQDEPWMVPLSYIPNRYESVHQHSMRITCVGEHGGYMVSGDAGGFVHLWCVGVKKAV